MIASVIIQHFFVDKKTKHKKKSFIHIMTNDPSSFIDSSFFLHFLFFLFSLCCAEFIILPRFEDKRGHKKGKFFFPSQVKTIHFIIISNNFKRKKEEKKKGNNKNNEFHSLKVTSLIFTFTFTGADK